MALLTTELVRTRGILLLLAYMHILLTVSHGTDGTRLKLPTSLRTLQAVLMASARVPPDILNEALSQAFPHEDARRLLILQHQSEP